MKWGPTLAGIFAATAIPFLIAALAALWFTSWPAHSRPGPQWAQVDEGTRDWFRSLHSATGFPCCDYADGSRLEDPEWRQDDSLPDGQPTYSVFLDGQWYSIPAEKVVRENGLQTSGIDPRRLRNRAERLAA